jgi:AmpE protein
MILITILLGLALMYFLGPMDRFRNYHWCDVYVNWLELKCQRFSLWDGHMGMLVTVALPILALLLVDFLLAELFIGFSYILAVLIFVYCLGPDLNIILSNYTAALEGNIEDEMAEIESTLEIESSSNMYDETAAISAILLRAHEYIFGVVFWFIILGMFGAVIFSLSLFLKHRCEGVHGNYSDSVQELYKILIWPSSRLLAIGFALSGSLVDTLDKWRSVEGDSFGKSLDIITESGMGAMQYQPSTPSNEVEIRSSYVRCVKEAQALVNRSLIVWLTILGLLTLGGILA